jgi:hypothetical protein
MKHILIRLLCSGTAVALAQTPVPKSTLVPSTADSYPLLAAAHNIKPLDLGETGYVEEEFIVSGSANVYDWAADGTIGVKTPNASYTGRILLRRPSDPARFSGAVIVELLNSARRFDWSMMWGYLGDAIVERGDAWVGITMPASVAGLQRFNPARYAALSFADPTPDAPCAGGAPSPTEEGLRWDMLSQVAAALKSNAPSQPMRGFRVQAVYMTTQAGDIVTYINAIHSHARLANGKPVYDGYLIKNPGTATRISQCSAAPANGDPRQRTHGIDVPVVAVVAQGEAIASLPSRRPDSDDPAGRYRLYEIAGAAHIDQLPYSSLPALADQIAAAGSAQGSADWPFNAPCDPPVPLVAQPLLKYSYDAALENVDQWVRKGIAPPKAARLEVRDAGTPLASLVLDEYGHAKGGVRSPYVNLPTANLHTATPGPGTCAELFSVTPFDQRKLETLYHPGGLSSSVTEAVPFYETRIDRSVDQLVKARFFTESDGKKIKAELRARFVDTLPIL